MSISIQNILKTQLVTACQELFSATVNPDSIVINFTNPEFEGNYTIVVFPLVKIAKLSPEKTGEVLGEYLVKNTDFIEKFNVVKGFLNLSFTSAFWISQLSEIATRKEVVAFEPKKEKVVLEYCGPNTNKPLHIGHLRNMMLGFSMGEVLKANGYDLTKVNIYNDRGIAICKSMVAYKRFGKNTTPQSTGIKGDHFVGDWYVKFSRESSKEREDFYQLVDDSIGSIVDYQEDKKEEIVNKVKGLREVIDTLRGKVVDDNFKDNPDAFLRMQLLKLTNIKHEIEKNTEPEVIVCHNCIASLEEHINRFLQQSIFSEAVKEVQKWEAGDAETIALWKQMNGWVYEGFNETFKLLGVDFQKDYYESDTYKLGKEIVEEGLQKDVFKKRTDGAVVVDLTPDGLDEKVLLRSDGTSIYITQDLATAELRHNEFGMDKMIYVVANEQDYHFKVLKLALQKLGKTWADGIYHLSYALVESPTGRFKSREGKTADADDLIADVMAIAKAKTQELGKIEDFTEEEANELYKTIGLGALKYFILRVNPYQKIIFNPEASIDFHGQTGPFIQYTHARIKSVIRKASGISNVLPTTVTLHKIECELIQQLSEYKNILESSANKYDPSEIANYIYNLAKLYNKFYGELKILGANDENEKQIRLTLSAVVANTIKHGMQLLGINVPEKM